MKMGFNAKLFRGVAGTTAATEVKNISDCSVNIEAGESEASVRGSSWKSYVYGLKDAGIEFKLMANDAAGSDENIAAFRDAFLNSTPIAVLALDKASGQGPDADWIVSNFSRDENLEDAIAYNVNLKPTTDLRNPTWSGGSAGGTGGTGE